MLPVLMILFSHFDAIFFLKFPSWLKKKLFPEINCVKFSKISL